jgi:hypothetical protein
MSDLWRQVEATQHSTRCQMRVDSTGRLDDLSRWCVAAYLALASCFVHELREIGHTRRQNSKLFIHVAPPLATSHGQSASSTCTIESVAGIPGVCGSHQYNAIYREDNDKLDIFCFY